VVIPATIVTPSKLRDADDAQVLAGAASAQADVIVSGDGDLLVLRAFQGIPILNAAQAWELLQP
jgi:predicted nucleic acid-binding protein